MKKSLSKFNDAGKEFLPVVPLKFVNKLARKSKRNKQLAGIKEAPLSGGDIVLKYHNSFIKRKCLCGDFHLCTKVTEKDLEKK